MSNSKILGNYQIVIECEVIKKDEKNIENYKKDMQNALDLAVKNDTSHIRKLSQIML